MRNWKLVERMAAEQRKRQSPWKNTLDDLLGTALAKTILAGLCLLAGIVMTGELKDGEWFGRAGCLITVLGMIALTSKIELVLDAVSAQQTAEDLEERVQKDASDIIAFTEHLDAGLLIFGTLLWGFGPPLANLILRLASP
jgi:hypothetical protein